MGGVHYEYHQFCPKDEGELAGTGKSDAVLTDIKLSVIDANEHVSQDPEGTNFWWEVDSHEAT